MAKKNKLQKFADITAFPNVLEAFTFDDGYLHQSALKKVRYTNEWASRFFGNEGPICLELACGKGEYTLGLSELNPEWNYIGMDIKGNRIWKGARRALEEKKTNVGFLRSRIEFINTYFGEDEISEIWIVFPDPFLKSGDENRRLTSPEFLSRYVPVLKNGGVLHLKTDSDVLYEFTLETIQEHPQFELLTHDDDIDQHPRKDALEIKTFYENQHLKAGKKIKYIQARLCK